MEDGDMDCWVEADQPCRATRKSSLSDWNSPEEKFLHSTRLFDGNKKKYVPKRNSILKRERQVRDRQEKAKEPAEYVQCEILLREINLQIDNLMEEDHDKIIKQFFRTIKRKGKGFFNCAYCGGAYDFWNKHSKFCKEYVRE